MSTRDVVWPDADPTDEHGSVPAATQASAGTAGLPGVPVPRFSESEQRRQWLDASSELLPLLLSGHAGPPHALIARHAVTAATADFAVLAVPYGADRVIVTGVAGELAAGMLNRTAPLAGSLTGQAILTGRPSLITGDRRAAVTAALGAATGPLIVVPLGASEQVRGALLLGRLATGPGFTEADLDMAVGFVGHAAVAMAMALAQARTDQIILAQVEDHDRIAGDLHDHVISELFALSMALQGHATRTDPATADRISGYVDTLDEIIKKIRTSIFGLHQRRQPPAGLPARLMEIIEEHTPQLGFAAGLRSAGPLDPDPDEALAHDILAVTREALSNCARHAHATAVNISLTSRDGLITLGITDNGRGLGTPARASGLASMRRRAARHGGTFVLTTPPDGGTRLTWSAPFSKKSNHLRNEPWFLSPSTRGPFRGRFECGLGDAVGGAHRADVARALVSSPVAAGGHGEQPAHVVHAAVSLAAHPLGQAVEQHLRMLGPVPDQRGRGHHDIGACQQVLDHVGRPVDAGGRRE